MDRVALAGDIVAAVGFAVAMAIAAITPAEQRGPLTPLTKWLVFAAFATRAYVSASKVFVYFAGPSVLEEFGDYIEVMFPVLLVMSVFSALMAQQIDDLARSQHAVQASGAMMLDMVDAAPAGILVLDGAGRITFANESARDILDLIEDPDTGGFTTPGWVVHDPTGALSNDFSYLVRSEITRPIKMTVQWENGWKVDLAVSARPLDEKIGREGGMVATFERPTLTV